MTPLARGIITALLVVSALALVPSSPAAARTGGDRGAPGALVSGPGASPGDAPDPCSVDPQDPCFTGVSDILGGRRYLLRMDDLVVVNVDNGVATTFGLPTSNSRIEWPCFQCSVMFAQQFAIGNPTPAFTSALGQGQAVAPVALGRLVNLPRDVVVTLLLGTDGQWHFSAADPPTKTAAAAVVPTSLPPASGGRSEQAVVLADFDGDGYVEALIAYLGQNAQGQLQGAMRIVKPVDVNDLSQGVTFTAEVATTPSIGLPFSTITTGDVNGDGFPEILSFDGTTLAVSTVDPATLQITQAASTVTISSALVFPFSLIAGRFRDTPFDDVVVAGQVGGGQPGTTVYSISGDPDLDLRLATSQFFRVDGTVYDAPPLVQVFLAKGPLIDQFSGPDLLVMGTANATEAWVAILSSDDALNLTLASNTMVTGPLTSVEAGCLYGLAVGNFDNQSGGQMNPALEIATLWRSMDRGRNSGCEALGTHQFNPAVRIWSVTPPPPGQQSLDWLTMLQDVEPFGAVVPSIGLVLAVGDLQGRSLVLGAPTVVRVQHLQPQVILGMPPMHVDWIAPVNGTSPEVLNLSAVYGGFFSTYQTAQTDQTSRPPCRRSPGSRAGRPATSRSTTGAAAASAR